MTKHPRRSRHAIPALDSKDTADADTLADTVVRLFLGKKMTKGLRSTTTISLMVLSTRPRKRSASARAVRPSQMTLRASILSSTTTIPTLTTEGKIVRQKP
ncbi:MAG: hypothetical protein JKY37_08555 [Nannocystaceae bacterium]|nr:hypothetical protein [Nannocystaceae bacterium]